MNTAIVLFTDGELKEFTGLHLEVFTHIGLTEIAWYNEDNSREKLYINNNEIRTICLSQTKEEA